jgi:hypothetical protein
VSSDLLDPGLLDPVDRGPQSDRLRDLRRAGLELPGQIGPGRLVRGHGADHVPTADERWHLLEHRSAPVQNSDPGRAVGLVPRPRVEVRVDRAQIDGHLRHRLRAIDQHHRPRIVCPLDDRGHRVDRPDDIRHVDEGDELRPARQQLIERVEIELSVVEHRHVGEFSLAVLTEDLPRDDVRVVLHLGQHDEVAAPDVLAAPCVGDQVDRRRRVRRKDRLLRRRAKPVGDPAPGVLVQVGRLNCERIHATMNRRPRLGVVAGHRVDHRLRRLRRRARVQVGERIPVERATQDGKFRADLLQARRGDGH